MANPRLHNFGLWCAAGGMVAFVIIDLAVILIGRPWSLGVTTAVVIAAAMLLRWFSNRHHATVTEAPPRVDAPSPSPPPPSSPYVGGYTGGAPRGAMRPPKKVPSSAVLPPPTQEQIRVLASTLAERSHLRDHGDWHALAEAVADAGWHPHPSRNTRTMPRQELN